MFNKRLHKKQQCGTVKWDLKLNPGSSKANFIEESITICLFLGIEKNLESIVPGK